MAETRARVHGRMGVRITRGPGGELGNNAAGIRHLALMSIPNMGRLFHFVGGGRGSWQVVATKTVSGEGLLEVARLDVRGESAEKSVEPGGWSLRGILSNSRYVTVAEKKQLSAKQAALGRKEATRAALIPIRKSAAWWDLAQEERRRIFEERSHHTEIGLRYLPEIARRLHHCRDLATPEPFDFLTWFEYAPEHAGLFEDLVGELRASEEWKYVDREVDIRLMR